MIDDIINATTRATCCCHELAEALAYAYFGAKYDIRMYAGRKCIKTGVYLLIIGDSTRSRKTDSRNFIRDLFSLVSMPITSKEGMWDELADNHHRIFYSDEFSAMLKRFSSDRGQDGLMQQMTEIWSMPEGDLYPPRQRTNTVLPVTDGKCTFVGTTTFSGFENTYHDEMNEGGFFYRFMLVLASNAPHTRRGYYVGNNANNVDAIKNKIDLTANMKYIVEYDQSVIDVIETLYVTSSDDSRVDRIFDHVDRFIMISAVDRYIDSHPAVSVDDVRVTATTRDLERAFEIVKRSFDDWQKLMKNATRDELLTKIINKLDEIPDNDFPIRAYALRSHGFKAGLLKDFSDRIKSLSLVSKYSQIEYKNPATGRVSLMICNASSSEVCESCTFSPGCRCEV